MTDLEKYKNAFVEGLDLQLENVTSASQQTIDTWDSIGQMSLIAVMEEAFNIEFQPEDIVEFDSYARGIELLKKYGIDI